LVLRLKPGLIQFRKCDEHCSREIKNRNSAANIRKIKGRIVTQDLGCRFAELNSGWDQESHHHYLSANSKPQSFRLTEEAFIMSRADDGCGCLHNCCRSYPE
jgi:hypothetical protein